jgi:hypothetical protein
MRSSLSTGSDNWTCFQALVDDEGLSGMASRSLRVLAFWQSSNQNIELLRHNHLAVTNSIGRRQRVVRPRELALWEGHTGRCLDTCMGHGGRWWTIGHPVPEPCPEPCPLPLLVSRRQAHRPLVSGTKEEVELSRPSRNSSSSTLIRRRWLRLSKQQDC